MVFRNRYFAIIWLQILLAERCLGQKTAANNISEVENDLDIILNKETAGVRRDLLGMYPNLVNITMMILNQMSSNDKPTCDVIKQNFVDSQCNSSMFPQNETCLGNGDLVSAQSDNWRGCYNIKVRSLRSRRDIDNFSPEDVTTSMISKISSSSRPQTPSSQALPTTRAPPQSQRSSFLPVPTTQAPPQSQRSSSPSVPTTQAPPQSQTSSFPPVPTTQAPPQFQKSSSPPLPTTLAPPKSQTSSSPPVSTTQAPPQPETSSFPPVPTTQDPPQSQKSSSPSVPTTKAPPHSQTSSLPPMPTTQGPPQSKKSSSPPVHTTQAPSKSQTSSSPPVPTTEAPPKSQTSSFPLVPTTQSSPESQPPPSPSVPTTQERPLSHQQWSPPAPTTQAPPQSQQPWSPAVPNGEQHPPQTTFMPTLQITTDPTRITTSSAVSSTTLQPYRPVANYYFLAINIIANTVSNSYERRCLKAGGLFEKNSQTCMLPPTHPPTQDLRLLKTISTMYQKEPPLKPVTTQPKTGETATFSTTAVGQSHRWLPTQTETQNVDTSQATAHLQTQSPKIKSETIGKIISTMKITAISKKSDSHHLINNDKCNSSSTSCRGLSTNKSFSFRNLFNYTTLSFTYPAWLRTIKIINISGHSCSAFSLFLLIATYFSLKPDFTLMDRNVVCLSVSLLLAHLLQLNMVFFSRIPMFCKWGAVFLHWSLLLSFMWIAAISFDLYTTFKSMKPITRHTKNKRFKNYSVAVAVISSIIIMVCVAIGIPSEDFSGYGDEGRCFIAKFWPNLFAFVLPVMIIFVASVILTTLTIHKLRSKQKESNRVLSTGSSRVSSRKKIIITSLVLKLSILFGFGWLIGFINGFIGSIPLYITFNVIVSFQGFFIYLAFGEQRSVVKQCFNKIKSYRQRKAAAKQRETDIATQTTSV